MKWLAVVFAVGLAGNPGMAQPAGADPKKPTARKLRESVLRSSDAGEAGAAYQALFESLDPKGIASLKYDEHCGIALQAAWELSRHPAPRRTTKPMEGKVGYEPRQLLRFVGFLEGRTRTEVPDWWEATMQDIVVGQNNDCHFFVSPELRKEQWTMELGLNVSRPTTLQADGDSIVVKVGDDKVRLSKAVIESVPRADYKRLTPSLHRDRSFIAFHSESGIAFTLLCLNTQTGELLWTSTVWGGGRTLGTGIGVHRLSFVRNGNVVTLFGAEANAAYVEAFDFADGRCLYRFCTAYWDNHPETWKRKLP